ncbi:Mur ligase family protein [Desemzia sp. FAM 24101]|uniref:Mur ligase family protein n=1 Tax=unclassified Desemzia TaxID=2685243 RepID=UPI0038872FB2
MKALKVQEYINQLVANDILIKTTIDQNSMITENVILQMTYDSREVSDPSLFICKGANFKEEYLRQAVSYGAVAYVSEVEYDVDAPVILVTDIREAMALLSSLFFDFPEKDLTLVGVTGTKGKTTTTNFIRSILDDYLVANQKKNSAYFSSVENYDGVTKAPSRMTTPEAMVLKQNFRTAVDSGVEFFEMEVSSQALKYDRTKGLDFEIGIFLNISEDHLSPLEHSDMDDYLNSKLLLFKQSKTICLNLDTDYLARIENAAKQANKVVTFSQHNEKADVYGYNVQKEDHHITFDVRTPQYTEKMTLGIAGLFNVENALAAIAAMYVLEIPVEYIKSGLLKARAKGRMELYTSHDTNLVGIVDYAHNRLSFEVLFNSLKKEYPNHQMIAVFGCPGGKAFNRRKEMGEVAGRIADMVYITEDDPANESVRSISEQVAEAVIAENGSYEIIEDRAEAIRKAMSHIEMPTVVAVVGKGAEINQRVGNGYVEYEGDAFHVIKNLETYNKHHI